MTEDPINDDWLISATFGAQDCKTGLISANSLQRPVQTFERLSTQGDRYNV